LHSVVHSADDAWGWEPSDGAVFHGRLYWPPGAQLGDNKNFLLFFLLSGNEADLLLE
jgi:hypothetical protein